MEDVVQIFVASCAAAETNDYNKLQQFKFLFTTCEQVHFFFDYLFGSAQLTEMQIFYGLTCLVDIVQNTRISSVFCLEYKYKLNDLILKFVKFLQSNEFSMKHAVRGEMTRLVQILAFKGLCEQELHQFIQQLIIAVEASNEQLCNDDAWVFNCEILRMILSSCVQKYNVSSFDEELVQVQVLSQCRLVSEMQSECDELNSYNLKLLNMSLLGYGVQLNNTLIRAVISDAQKQILYSSDLCDQLFNHIDQCYQTLFIISSVYHLAQSELAEPLINSFVMNSLSTIINTELQNCVAENSCTFLLVEIIKSAPLQVIFNVIQDNFDQIIIAIFSMYNQQLEQYDLESFAAFCEFVTTLMTQCDERTQSILTKIAQYLVEKSLQIGKMFTCECKQIITLMEAAHTLANVDPNVYLANLYDKLTKTEDKQNIIQSVIYLVNPTLLQKSDQVYTQLFKNFVFTIPCTVQQQVNALRNILNYSSQPIMFDLTEKQQLTLLDYLKQTVITQVQQQYYVYMWEYNSSYDILDYYKQQEEISLLLFNCINLSPTFQCELFNLITSDEVVLYTTNSLYDLFCQQILTSDQFVDLVGKLLPLSQNIRFIICATQLVHYSNPLLCNICQQNRMLTNQLTSIDIATTTDPRYIVTNFIQSESKRYSSRLNQINLQLLQFIQTEAHIFDQVTLQRLFIILRKLIPGLVFNKQLSESCDEFDESEHVNFKFLQQSVEFLVISIQSMNSQMQEVIQPQYLSIIADFLHFAQESYHCDQILMVLKPLFDWNFIGTVMYSQLFESKQQTQSIINLINLMQEQQINQNEINEFLSQVLTEQFSKQQHCFRQWVYYQQVLQLLSKHKYCVSLVSQTLFTYLHSVDVQISLDQIQSTIQQSGISDQDIAISPTTLRETMIADLIMIAYSIIADV
ncbi:Hypothetical_protein [Hexamita inflata]|uniref:Hypothetical_protein n=1 Tax=Hexamita inflata TaxID=28002 RepID=A0AA86U9J6_9EUKA|nr:Hypothetical protein HINF_LOCUS36465 [Hexamita inflata]